MLSGKEFPAEPEYKTELLYPCYVNHPYAIYEKERGHYSVTTHGIDDMRPFVTTDRCLAETVCDAWKEAFSEFF